MSCSWKRAGPKFPFGRTSSDHAAGRHRTVKSTDVLFVPVPSWFACQSVADIDVALWFSLSSEEEYMSALKTGVAATVSLFAIWAPANAEHQQVSDAEYTTQALSAAPEAVAKGAAVVRVEHDGTLRTLREGNNGF